MTKYYKNVDMMMICLYVFWFSSKDAGAATKQEQPLPPPAKVSLIHLQDMVLFVLSRWHCVGWCCWTDICSCLQSFVTW